MIFVTVGTTLPFDALIEQIDQLKASGLIRHEVICQIGHGQFAPKHCDYFRFRPSVDDLIDRASLVIGHGGTGTVLGLLQAGKSFIAVANPLAADAHQELFLRKLSKVASVIWTKDLQELGALIESQGQTASIQSSLPSLSGPLGLFIESCLQRRT